MDPKSSAPEEGDDEAPPPSLDSDLDRVLEAFLKEAEAGRPLDPSALIAAHPEFADELRACLQLMDMADRLIGPRGDEEREGEQPPAATSSPAQSERLRRVQRAIARLAELSREPDTEYRGGLAPQLASAVQAYLDSRQLGPSIEGDAAGVGASASAGRYRLLGEIGGGGMGTIYRARDDALDRELAVKVIRADQPGDSQQVLRFVEEARIAGRLQHPGIVPVYDVGQLADRRPFFAMKLVEGRTLSELLGGQSSPLQELPRYVAIFLDVCQAMAFAHSRGVIHRDLKPSNVMVGAFGEVMVMDWGLAKVIARGAEAGTSPDDPAQPAMQEGPFGSSAGSIVGTPSHMAPEQARGETGRVDERADVFGLGAILCEILTGRPPFEGGTQAEIRSKAAQGNLADALARLAASGADAELIELARNCLAIEPEQRPRHAGEVAVRISAYQAGVQERLRAAKLAQVEAQAHATDERRRRRLVMGLAASVLATFLIVVGGWAWMARQRAARQAAMAVAVNQAMEQAILRQGQARSAAQADPGKWTEALAAIGQAEGLLAAGESEPALRTRVLELKAEIEHEQADARAAADQREKDRTLAERVEEIRGSQAEHRDPARSDGEYTAAFRDYGIDLDHVDPKEAGARIARRPVAVEVAAALDDWALIRRRISGSHHAERSRRLLVAAQVADPDPWRNALRDVISGDPDLAVLRRLSENKESATQPPPSLVLLANALRNLRDFERAATILRAAWHDHPEDFGVNFELGRVTGNEGLNRLEESVRHFSAAVAIRPRSYAAHTNLAAQLVHLGRLDDAIAEAGAALRLKSDFAEAHNNLGNALRDQALAQRNRNRLDEAMAEFRTAIRLQPDLAQPHHNLATILNLQGKHQEAVTESREAVRLRPDAALAHVGLADNLSDLGKPDEALAEYRAAVRLNPGAADAHFGVARGLAHGGDVDGAIVEYRETIRLKPEFPEALCNLGLALRQKGQYAEALTVLRRGHELGSKNPDWGYPSAEWVRMAERAVELDKKLPEILNGKAKPTDGSEAVALAQMCSDRQLYGASARLWEDAFKIRPALANDMKVQNRYNAACAAALAGSGQGKDDPPLDDAAKAHWRKQAIEWLRADLAFWAKLMEKGPPQARPMVLQTLQHWQSDSDLAGIRGENSLSRLSKAEQSTCQALWEDVAALLKKASETRSTGAPAS